MVNNQSREAEGHERQTKALQKYQKFEQHHQKGQQQRFNYEERKEEEKTTIMLVFLATLLSHAVVKLKLAQRYVC